MKSKLQILYLEDEPNDVEIVHSMLQKGDIECEITRVDTRDDFADKLVQEDFDLIFADYSLPEFDGLTALGMAKKIRPDVPLIIVSGTLGEEVAIDCMKDGSSDYVLKERLSRLIPAVKRALREAKDRIKLKETMSAFRESEEQNRLFLQNFVGIAYQINPASLEPLIFHGLVEEITGYNEKEIMSKGFTFDRLIHPKELPIIRKELIKLKSSPDYVADNEYRIIRKDKKICWVRDICRAVWDDSGKASFIQGAAYDITEKKRLETQLIQAQKMESIGTLAGGIAHDFNNILGIIIGNTELAMREIPKQSPVLHNLEEVHKACIRARDVVMQILMFSRKSEHELTPIHMDHIVKESLKLIRASIPSTIEIKQKISGGSEAIMGDPTQINQVLLNLCSNASHAMRGEGGILNIALEVENVSDKLSVQYQGLRPGKYVKLSVSDTGYGIEPEIIERIFDPYFSTKDMGDGTGLGLSLVHGIVKNHKGTVLVESELGKGATFHVLLPW